MIHPPFTPIRSTVTKAALLFSEGFDHLSGSELGGRLNRGNSIA